MNLRDGIVIGLLATGVLGFLCTSLGLLLFHDVYQQIHFLAPGSLIGATTIPTAVLVHEGFSQAGSKAILIALLLSVANPVLSHATARAARIRRKHQWPPTEDEQIPLAVERQ
jgi:monovalent cation/proton antiporter MnhG/PhaG subunit